MSPVATHMVPGGRFMQNIWLLWDEASRDAVLVDPGEETPRALAAIRHRELTVREIWLTHAHLDHVWGVTEARYATGAPVLLHPLDRRWYDHFPRQGLMFGIPGLEPLDPPDGDLAHGQRLRVGETPFEVRHVPGHAPGHVAFVGGGVAVSGDVIFEGGIGRTDLAGGDEGQLLDSIRREILTLPDATRLLTGHGAETTVGRERTGNPWIRPHA